MFMKFGAAPRHLIAVAVLVVATVASWSIGCGKEQRKVISSQRSPSGTHVAYLERVAKGGGATVGFVYQIVVVKSDVEFDVDRDRSWIWTAYATLPVSYSWADGTTVVVKLSRSRKLSMESVRTREQHGVTAQVIVTD
jgi:hypothetical protein